MNLTVYMVALLIYLWHESINKNINDGGKKLISLARGMRTKFDLICLKEFGSTREIRTEIFRFYACFREYGADWQFGGIK